MDGSRRITQVYCKTQSGVDALASARGALSSSARQLLILLDGQRDFDELSGIFGEDALYRLLPLLESQGYVQPMHERADAQDDQAHDPEQPPPMPAAEVTAADKPAKSPRYLAVPIAIVASVLTALVIVNWIFSRERPAAENAQASSAAPAIAAAPDSGKQASTSAVTDFAKQATRESGTDLGKQAASRSAADTGKPPAGPSAPVPGAQSKTQQALASSPSSSVVLNAEPQRLPALAVSPPPGQSRQRPPEAPGQSNETTARAAPRPKVASETTSNAPKATATRNVQTLPPTGSVTLGSETDRTATQAKTPAPAVPVLNVRSRVLPAISKQALAKGIYGGKAVVRLQVGSAGTVERVELISASPPEVYGPDVQHALEQWTFEPPSNPAQFTLELEFRAQDAASPAANSKPPEGP